MDKTNLNNSKKGQITIFIIAGVIVLLLAGIIFFIGPQLQSEDISDVPLEAQPLKLFVEECLSSTAIEGIRLAGIQGGYVDIPEFALETDYSTIAYYYDQGKNKIMKILKQNGPGIQRLYDRQTSIRKRAVSEKVRRIIEDVQLHGDDAIIKYTKRFDKVKLEAKQLRVSENEISCSFQNITSDFISDLKIILNNVSLFYKKQIQKPARIRHDDGILLKENILPLE